MLKLQLFMKIRPEGAELFHEDGQTNFDFCQILIKLDFFPTDFRKMLKLQLFMKIRPEGAELFHEDRQTDFIFLSDFDKT